MKKSLRKAGTLALLAVATSAACAQSSGSGITLYGLVDMGLERADSGSVSSTRLNSGITAGSRWGLKGTEELSPGWKALFTLESRIEADNGSMLNNGSLYICGTTPNCAGVTLVAPYTGLPAGTQATLLGGANLVNDTVLRGATTVNAANALFDRQAFVGLVTPVGAFVLGRQYTPGYEALVKFNAFGDGFAGSPAQLSQTTIRSNNAIQYRVEKDGFIGALMYGLGGTEVNRSERATGPQSGDDFYGANLQYANDVFGVAVGYNRNNTVTLAAPTESRKGLETMSLGGYYAIGPVKLFSSFLKAKNDNPVLTPEGVLGLLATQGAAGTATTLSALYIGRGDVDGLRGVIGPVNLKVFHIGGQVTVSPSGTVLIAYNQAKDSARSAWATADAKVDQFGLAYLHKLSVRTQLYAGYALANNRGQARAALGGAGYLGGLTTGQGVDSRVAQLGMRHSF